MVALDIKKPKKQQFTILLPQEWRRKAQELAEAQSTDETRITEADVYRHILGDFFGTESPNCVPNGQ